MVFLSYFLFKKYYITWFIISNHYKLNVLIYYRLLIVCNTSCLIWTTMLWRKMLCRVYSLFHRISKKHYHLNFSLFIEYIVTYYCPFSFLLCLYIIEVFIDITGNRLRNVVISVGPNLKKMNIFATFRGPGRSGGRYIFKCKEVTTGRYVKVMIKGAEYLTLAEIQVFSPGMSEHSLLK